MNSDALGALKTHPLFKNVLACDLPGVLDAPDTVELAEGEILFRQDEDALRLYLIVQGMVELGIERPGHPPEVQTRLGAGAAVGTDAIMPAGRHAVTARAVEPTLAVAVVGQKLTRYLDANFDQAIDMIALMAGALRGQIREITELKLQSTTERLASYLAGLAGDIAGHAVVRLPFEKRQLAERLGMEPATLSRAFAKLREFGVETGRGDRVEIADVAGLRRLGESLDMPFDGGLS